MSEINILLGKLTKLDFVSKYTNAVSNYTFDSDDEEDEYDSKKVREFIINLADEFVVQDLDWQAVFPLFYKGNQIYASGFSKKVYELIKTDEERVKKFIEISLSTISKIPKNERNITVLEGFLYSADIKLREDLYKRLEEDPDLNYLLFSLIAYQHPTFNDLDILFKLLDEGKCAPEEFIVLKYHETLSDFSEEDLNKFCKKMFSYGKTGYKVVFDLVYSYNFRNQEKTKELLPVFKECILSIGIDSDGKSTLDNYIWFEKIALILEDERETDFAIFINKAIINSISVNKTYHIDMHVRKVYEVLMKKHFNAIWKDISSTLLFKDEEYIKFYALKNILGSHIGRPEMFRQVGILFDGNLDMIFEWGKGETPLAPMRLAELVPVFGEVVNHKNTWHPIARRLIDEFGSSVDVLRILSSNMGTFSWTGSIVPYLESKKQLFEELVNHITPQVSNWAINNIPALEEHIKLEKNRDAEMYI
jgi:hypothetical protein